MELFGENEALKSFFDFFRQILQLFWGLFYLSIVSIFMLHQNYPEKLTMVTRIVEHQLKRDLYRNNDIICKNIKFLRLVTGATQQELADYLCMTRSTYYAMERCVKIPEFELICRICEYYNVNIDYLVSYDIKAQILKILQPDTGEINAVYFLERYLCLSQTGKEQIRAEIERIKSAEKEFNNFPWAGNLERNITDDGIT